MPYDDTMIVIYGYGAAGKHTAINRRSSDNVWIHGLSFVAPLIVVAFIWLRIGRTPVFLFYALVVMASAALVWWRRSRISSPKPVQLRLVPEGFAQRDGFGAVTLRPWNTWALRVRIRRRGDRTWILGMGRPWLMPQLRPFAAIEFETDLPGAEHVRQRVEAWISTAGGEGEVRLEPKPRWWEPVY